MEDNTTTTGALRPTFLTVLCILTFLGSGWGIISAMINYSSADTAGEAAALVEEQMDEALDQMDDNEEVSEKTKGFMESFMGGVAESITPQNIRKMAIVSVLSSLLTLFGAIFMWKLNKSGFYMYIGGVLVLIVGTMLVYGGLLGAVAAGGSGFVGVLFIVLYGLNLKHMH
ncbi:MAG: hypothetical protein RLZZ337_1256 [Bacteroidota bacterium]|jgi:Mg2+ and Co2+ transporter CorA